MRDDFAVIIISHGRPHSVTTWQLFIDAGYTGKIYLLLDNEDETRSGYEEEFGEQNVLIFDKQYYIDTVRAMDNFAEHRSALYARCACFDVARDLGLQHFLMMDDDTTSIMFRYVDHGVFKGDQIKGCIDEVFEAMCDFLDESGALTVGFAQGGDFIGGAGNKNFEERLLRKVANNYFCRVDRPIDFRGTINEDITAHTNLGSQGKLFLSAVDCNIVQRVTQTVAGGVSEYYSEHGTYTKSFYPLMASPSCMSIIAMGNGHARVHHRIEWNNCVPKILNECWKK